VAVVGRWWGLADTLIETYADGFIRCTFRTPTACKNSRDSRMMNIPFFLLLFIHDSRNPSQGNRILW